MVGSLEALGFISELLRHCGSDLLLLWDSMKENNLPHLSPVWQRPYLCTGLSLSEETEKLCVTLCCGSLVLDEMWE